MGNNIKISGFRLKYPFQTLFMFISKKEDNAKKHGQITHCIGIALFNMFIYEFGVFATRNNFSAWRAYFFSRAV